MCTELAIKINNSPGERGLHGGLRKLSRPAELTVYTVAYSQKLHEGLMSPANVNRLRNLALRPQLSGMSNSLRELAVAVESPSGSNAVRWANVDLFVLFLGTASLPPIKSRRVQRAPAILVFAPVLVTWTGLAVGMYYYRATLHDRGMDGQGLLQRWEGRFGGQMPWLLSFDVFALLTVVAILALISVSLRANAIERRQQEELAELRHELHQALVGADVALAPCRNPVLGSLTTELNQIGAEIERATKGLAATAAEFIAAGTQVQRVQQEVTAAAREIKSSTEALGEASTAVQDAAGMAAGAAEAVGDEIGRASTAYDRLATATTTVGQQISDAGDRVGSRLGDVATAFADRLRKATDGNQQAFTAAVDASAGRLTSALDKGAEQVRDALVDLRTTGAAYTSRVENAGDVLGRAAEKLADLDTAATTVNRTLTAVDSTETRIAHTLGELKVAIDGASAAVTQEALLTAIGSLATTMQGMRTELSTISRAGQAMEALHTRSAAQGAAPSAAQPTRSIWRRWLGG
ncbi:hypothetical protein [Actinomadura rubrisoli]|uniref:Uncharacterized protein n=1 Tax=Actinomadura rubrisoli TaxID=2530368 RepID=A0A4V6PER0_9ACTN|nr:hypothetical protein [Actinomadura rubrisoli]TDD78007.1 hypothetical protein E1298_29065 [Actinomadura rubrisoli]